MIAKVISTNESVIYNGKIYGFDDEFEVSDEIGKFLIERGLIAGKTDNANLFPEDEVEDVEEILEAVEMRNDIDEMSYPELKSYASELGLSASGTKVELIERIKEHFADLDEAEETEELPDTSMPE